MASDETIATSGAELPRDHVQDSPHAPQPISQEFRDSSERPPEMKEEQSSDQIAQVLPRQEESVVYNEQPAESLDNDPPLKAQYHSAPKQEASYEDNDGDISVVSSLKPNKDVATSFPMHRRADSMPPQKYNVTDDATAGLSASFASTSLHSAIEEEESDISLPHHDDSTLAGRSEPQSPSAFNSFGQHFLPSQNEEPESLLAPTAIDKADLNFVDITLDGPAEEPLLSLNLLGPPHPLSGSARTAEQIRRDSFSSQKLAADSSAAAEQSELGPASGPNVSVSVHDSSPPLSPEQGSQDNPSVEGRYRGRRSVVSSSNASPTRSPNQSPSLSRRASVAQTQAPGSHLPGESSSPHNGPPVTSTPVLLAADEHGIISVVSDVPVSPRTVPEALQSAPEGGKGSQFVDAKLSASDQSSTQGSSSHPISAQTEPIESTREPALQGPAATSLSDEVEAADAAQISVLSTSEKSIPKTSSLAPRDEDQLNPTASPGLSDKADQVDSKARRKSSSSGVEQVESRTRMTTLPAKTKTEEIKHRADFERMMMAAKEVERKKREEEEEKKRRRQDEQRQALGRWEKEILPSWSRARKDPELAQLWWKGAPPSIRGRVWALAIGNPLMLPRNLLEQSEKRAAGGGNKPIEQTIPFRILDQIDQDVEDALPSLRLFQADSPLHDDLVRLCRAFVLVRMEQVAELDVAGDADKAASRHQDASPFTRKAELSPVSGATEPNASSVTRAEGATPVEAENEDEYARRGIDLYQPGLANLAAVLLINMSINTAFIALLNLFHSKPWLKTLYSLLPTAVPPPATSVIKLSVASTIRKPGSAYALSPKEKQIRGFERVLETLLADQMPKVYANLLAHNVKLYRVVLRDWVATLWSRWLDVDTVMRLWDVVLLDETDSLIYRVCLALVQTLESRLYVPDQEELESVLKGTNRAALAIWRREKEMKGELMVHAKHGLTSTRHSRSSTSSVPPQSSDNGLSIDGRSASNSGLETNLLPDGRDSISIPPPRTSSLVQPHQQSTETVETHATTEFNPESIVPRDYFYEQYSITEDTVFAALEAQQSWWKPSTLERLLDRELNE